MVVLMVPRLVENAKETSIKLCKYTYTKCGEKEKLDRIMVGIQKVFANFIFETNKLKYKPK